MNKKGPILIIIVSVIVALILVGISVILSGEYPKWRSLLNYNLMEILTATIIAIAILYLTKRDNDTKSKNEKIANIIEALNLKINTVFGSGIDISKQAEYLHSFKYIDNKIILLEKLAKHLDCGDQIQHIKDEKQKLDDFITETINQGNDYFLREEVKDKVPNILVNIDKQLDNIIAKVY